MKHADDWIYQWRAHRRELRDDRRRVRSILMAVAGTAVFMLGLFWAALVSAQTVPPDAHRYQRDLIRSARSVWGMEAPTATLAAQVHQESAWRPDARSRVGAQGLTQFMPRTGEWIQGLYGAELGPYDPYNPVWALRAQARYMHYLYQRVEAINDCEQMAFALAAYNGGLGWVNRRKALSEHPSICLAATCDINPGITDANQRENSRYPHRILLALEPAYVRAGFGIGVCT